NGLRRCSSSLGRVCRRSGPVGGLTGLSHHGCVLKGACMRVRASLAVGALLVLATSHLAAGQGFQGGIRGALKDTGGVVPGVEVTLTNEQTNVKRSTVTNERGEYVFANVDPGN